MKNFLRSITPTFLLNSYRNAKKNAVRNSLEKQEKEGLGATFSSLVNDFRKCGITQGDSVLVHIGFSKLGFVEGGAATFINALQDVIGEKGNILMPSSPNNGLQLEYIQSNPVFDVAHSPSKMGILSEYFRKLPGVIRSESPTEPVCCLGPDAVWFTSGHKNEPTPYSANSPFARLVEKKGKILYIGVTLDNAGTSLHVLEDAVADFPFPVYFAQEFEVNVVPINTAPYKVKVKVHNPLQSAKRKCDELLPMFEEAQVAKKQIIAKAETWVFDAEGMFLTMLEAYNKKGISMYTPKGVN